MEKEKILKGIENLMNELAGFWFDSLDINAKTRLKSQESLNNLCPGVIWVWKLDNRRRLCRIEVLDFKDPAPVNPGATSVS